MSETPATREADRDAVVAVLRGAGPYSLSRLREHPELAHWTSERVEHAVVQAWSDSLVSVDAEDQLIAL